MNDWKKVEVGDNWNYKELGEGADIIGLYVGKDEHIGENDSTVYRIETDGVTISVWGSTVLDARMTQVKIGNEVRIVYKGSKPSEKRKGKTYHDFEVFQRETPMTAIE